MNETQQVALAAEGTARQIREIAVTADPSARITAEFVAASLENFAVRLRSIG